MEGGAIVALVLGSNAIMGLVNWFVTRMQIKNSEKQFEERMQAQREADEHSRRWVVRSQPLVKLREELAVMAERFEDMVDLAIQVAGGAPLSLKKSSDDLNKAVERWDRYLQSGEFYQAVHMQYNYELKREAHQILLDYASAYKGIWPFLKGGGGEGKIDEAGDVIGRNAKKIAEVQSDINKLLEGL
jgi:hypothetical protein